MPKIRALLLDLSGTLHVADTPTPGAAAAVDRLRKSGVLLRYVSNTSKESKSSLLGKMAKMGLDVREDELFTSLSAVRHLVEERNLNPLYLLTPSARSDFPPSSADKSPDSVVVGLAPESLSYQNGLNAAFRLLSGEEGDWKRAAGEGQREGRQPALIATHKAMYFGDKDGKLSLGPGPFISALEEATGAQAEIVGKPTRAFFEMALRSLEKDGITREDWHEVGMIGDDWRQDCGSVPAELGLQRFLVKTGKYRTGDEIKLTEEGGVRPEWCGENLSAAVDNILNEARAS